MKIALLGCSGHWRLAVDGLPKDRHDLEWHVAPVDVSIDALGIPTEEMSPVLQALTQGDLRAQQESRPQAGQRAQAHSDWRTLLDQARPDVAVVNPPFHLIGTVVRECLARGIHVFAEKPLAIAGGELAEVRKLATAAGAPKLMAMLAMRYSSEFLAGNRYVTSGGLGNPVLLAAQKSYPLLGWDGKARPAFYHRRATYGGTIPWIGIHALDLFRWYAASPFTDIKAWHTTAGNQNHGEMEAAALIEIKTASGALATAQLDFLRQRRTGAWGDDRLRVAGDKGVLEIRQGKVFVQSEAEEFRELAPEPVPHMFSAFLDWVERETPMLLDTEDCLAATEAALLARDAADRDQP